jgi:hypothetical protein
VSENVKLAITNLFKEKQYKYWSRTEVSKKEDKEALKNRGKLLYHNLLAIKEAREAEEADKKKADKVTEPTTPEQTQPEQTQPEQTQPEQGDNQ